MESNQEFTVKSPDAGCRLDILCVAHYPGFSRAQLQQLIKSGDLTVNDLIVKPRYMVKEGDRISIKRAKAPVLVPSVAPLALDIPIIYEDRHVVVINKPAGVNTHSGTGITGGTIADWFAARYKALLPVGEPGRSGIVHRLDKDTSGVMILAKSQPALDHLKYQFQQRRAKKEYLALVHGLPGESDGRITRALARSRHNPTRRTVDPAGKPAITEWRLEKKLRGKFSLLRVFPLTGRTHQIRVHLHFLGFPIVGDPLYVFKRQKSPFGVTRQMLHAEVLTIVLPTGQQKIFAAPLAEDFAQVIDNLRVRHAVQPVN